MERDFPSDVIIGAQEGESVAAHRIFPEEVALVVAASRATYARRASVIESSDANIGKVYSIGAVYFPPAIQTPSRSLQEAECWYEAFTSLWRDRHWIQYDKGRAYKMADPGWQFIDTLKASGVKDSEGSFVWDKVGECLNDLGKAQASKSCDEINRQSALLLQLSGKLTPAI